MTSEYQKIMQILNKKLTMDYLLGHTYTLSLSSPDVLLLHGLMKLAMKHPLLEKVSPSGFKFAERLSEWCKEIYREWGLSEEEIAILDRR